MNAAPRPPPLRPPRRDLGPGSRLLIALSVLAGVAVAAALGIRGGGWAQPYTIPNGAMSPAIRPGDMVVAEKFSLARRRPARGDIVIFKTDGLPQVASPTRFVKRVVGRPGEKLRLAEGDLIVNGARVSLSNEAGRIRYDHPPAPEWALLLRSDDDEVTVPPDAYLVLGDNTTNSLDSRYYGFVPASSLVGRVAFRYWPPGRAGAVR